MYVSLWSSALTNDRSVDTAARLVSLKELGVWEPFDRKNSRIRSSACEGVPEQSHRIPLAVHCLFLPSLGESNNMNHVTCMIFRGVVMISGKASCSGGTGE